MYDKYEQEFIDTLILEGALVIQGVDADSGEIVYSFTDKLAEMAPELYKGFMEMIHGSIMSLWEKGFINMDVTSNNPMVSPTPAGLEQDNWKILSDTEKQTMKALVAAFGGTF